MHHLDVRKAGVPSRTAKVVEERESGGWAISLPQAKLTGWSHVEPASSYPGVPPLADMFRSTYGIHISRSGTDTSAILGKLCSKGLISGLNLYLNLKWQLSVEIRPLSTIWQVPDEY